MAVPLGRMYREAADCLLIPAVAETQNGLICRHDVQKGSACQPSTYWRVWAAVVTQPGVFKLTLGGMILSQRYDLHDDIDVASRPNGWAA